MTVPLLPLLKGVLVVAHPHPRSSNPFDGLGFPERHGTHAVEASPPVVPVFVDPSGHRQRLVRGSAGVLAIASVAFIAGTVLLLGNQPMTSASGESGPNSAPESHSIPPGQEPVVGTAVIQPSPAAHNSVPRIAIPANALSPALLAPTPAGGNAPVARQPAGAAQSGPAAPANRPSTKRPSTKRPTTSQTAVSQPPTGRADPGPGSVVPTVVAPPPTPAAVTPEPSVVPPATEVAGPPSGSQP